MKDDKRFKDLLNLNFRNVKTEEDAKRIYVELKPQLENLTNKLFKEDEVNSDDTIDIDWINEISEYIIDTIHLYLCYHNKGVLKHIHLSLSEQNPPDIFLTIDEKDYFIDFNAFKNGTCIENRDDHRECYYRSESIWNEYRNFSTCFDFTTAGDEICNKIKDAFSPVTINYTVS